LAYGAGREAFALACTLIQREIEAEVPGYRWEGNDFIADMIGERPLFLRPKPVPLAPVPTSIPIEEEPRLVDNIFEKAIDPSGAEKSSVILQDFSCLEEERASLETTGEEGVETNGFHSLPVDHGLIRDTDFVEKGAEGSLLEERQHQQHDDLEPYELNAKVEAKIEDNKSGPNDLAKDYLKESAELLLEFGASVGVGIAVEPDSDLHDDESRGPFRLERTDEDISIFDSSNSVNISSPSKSRSFSRPRAQDLAQEHAQDHAQEHAQENEQAHTRTHEASTDVEVQASVPPLRPEDKEQSARKLSLLRAEEEWLEASIRGRIAYLCGKSL